MSRGEYGQDSIRAGGAIECEVRTRMHSLALRACIGHLISKCNLI